MPENSNNNEEIKINPERSGKISGGNNNEDDTFDGILAAIKKKIEDDNKKAVNAKLPDPNLSGELHQEALEKRAEQDKKYEEKRNNWERANAHWGDMKLLNNELRMSAEEKEEQIRQDSQEKIQEAIRKNMAKDLSERQKLVVQAAGERATEVLYSVAQEMESLVEKGGASAFLIITLTYIIAFAKDISDIASGTILSFATGIVASTILGFFWMLAAESWHGGNITTALVRKMLTRILACTVFDSLPLFGLIPTYIVINFWCHHDFKKMIKKAERELEDANLKMDQVQKETKNAINRISSV
jgi:hypothetical protein